MKISRILIALFLIVAMCMSLCACGSTDGSQQKYDDSDDEKVEETESILVNNRDGDVIIKSSRFGECIDEVIELTCDNWNEYIEIKSYEEIVVDKDPFGEVVNEETFEHYVFGVKTEKYYRFEEVAIELRNIETGETTIYDFAKKYPTQVEKNFDIGKYECTRIKGRIYLVTIPAEAIEGCPETWGYECGFAVGDKSGHGPYEINAYTGQIYHNGDEVWKDIYMKK